MSRPTGRWVPLELPDKKGIWVSGGHVWLPYAEHAVPLNLDESELGRKRARARAIEIQAQLTNKDYELEKWWGARGFRVFKPNRFFGL